MHCHFGPESVIGAAINVRHAVDPVEAATEGAALGFDAIVLKSHDFPSNAAAYLAGQAVPDIRVYGSVCCDFCIGGLNPSAVETALRDGAAVVWLPTISSQQDFDTGVATFLHVPGPGIRLLTDDGALRDEVNEILDLVDQYGAIAATGHTSTQEHFAVARHYARRGRLVVTHAMNAGAGPGLSVNECVELAELGAHIELSAATCMQSHGPAIDDVFKAIGRIGSEQVILSTDYGWNSDMPHPAVGFHSYIDALWSEGATEAQLRAMACDNPARLLNLGP
jgi:hypothetical protein